MEIETYRDQVERGLVRKPGVAAISDASFRQMGGPNRASYRARLTFYDESFLDLVELVDTSECYPVHARYAYQYIRANVRVFRYDNSPHHPELSSFPDHKHIGGSEDLLVASRPPTLSELFDEIKRIFV